MERMKNGEILERYTEWLGEFLDSWQDLDWQRTLNLFAEDVQYFETPSEAPCNDFAEVTELWSAVAENQRDIHYNYQILLCNSERCVANWQMKRVFLEAGNEVPQEIDGIFLIELDERRRCRYFLQWRFVKVLRERGSY